MWKIFNQREDLAKLMPFLRNPSMAASHRLDGCRLVSCFGNKLSQSRARRAIGDVPDICTFGHEHQSAR